MLPSFFVVGAQKSGTTSLHEYLSAYPQICLPEQKETKFFVDDERYRKGLQYYEQEYFSKCDPKAIIGEVDPDYMYFEHALERINSHFDIKTLKFIFILRNPADRAYSHYLMTYRRGLEEYTFEKALAAECERIKQGYDSRLHFSYFDRGFYAKQIRRFLKFVESSQVLFILSEDLKQYPDREVERCLRFLGIKYEINNNNSIEYFNRAAVPRSIWLLRLIKKEGVHKKFIRILMPIKKIRLAVRSRIIHMNQRSAENMTINKTTMIRLQDMYKEDICELENITGLDLSNWKYAHTT
jgi:hypothetical protein